MKAEEVYNIVRNKYFDQKYMLSNSYVFDWESDIFFKTIAGLFVEFEVKVSKSDFKADFKKVDKHNILSHRFAGKKTILIKTYNTYKITYDEMVQKRPREYCEIIRNYIRIPSGNRVIHTYNSSEEDMLKFTKRLNNPSVEQTQSGIEIKTVPYCPHKFYYVCPEGLIQKEEVPKYAGLAWVTEDGGFKIVKNSPKIHKEIMDLNKVLLDKFYYRCLKLENYAR